MEYFNSIKNGKFLNPFNEFKIIDLKNISKITKPTNPASIPNDISVAKKLNEFLFKSARNPSLTDEKLMDLLNEKGYNIARRTVAKYREQLNIPVARMRKEL